MQNKKQYFKMSALVNDDIIYKQIYFRLFPTATQGSLLQKKIFMFGSVTNSTRKVEITLG